MRQHLIPSSPTNHLTSSSATNLMTLVSVSLFKPTTSSYLYHHPLPQFSCSSSHIISSLCFSFKQFTNLFMSHCLLVLSVDKKEHPSRYYLLPERVNDKWTDQQTGAPTYTERAFTKQGYFHFHDTPVGRYRCKLIVSSFLRLCNPNLTANSSRHHVVPSTPHLSLNNFKSFAGDGHEQ